MKKYLQKIAAKFFTKLLYKIFFTSNFVRNIYKFYNFIGSNYTRRNYLLIKIFKQNNKKKILTNFVNKIIRKNLM